jgi:hypothetical protein
LALSPFKPFYEGTGIYRYISRRPSMAGPTLAIFKLGPNCVGSRDIEVSMEVGNNKLLKYLLCVPLMLLMNMP